MEQEDQTYTQSEKQSVGGGFSENKEIDVSFDQDSV